MEYKMLLSPIKIGNMTLKNRCVMAPMSSEKSNEQGEVTPEMIEYFVARAKGGFAMLFTDFAYIDPTGCSAYKQLSVADDSKIPGLKKLADAVHEQDCKLGLQIQHAGRYALRENGNIPYAPSAFPTSKNEPPARVMETAEVYELIQKYIDAGGRGYKAGFDAIEIHCTHGYMLNEFLSPRGNRRTDEFGGSMEGRARIVVKIIQGIKAATTPDYPVTTRLNPNEMLAGGMTPDELVGIALLLEEAGADAVSLSCGHHGTGIAPAARGIGYNLPGAELLKKVLSIPVIVAGRIHDPVYAESVLSAGRADVIALGRQALADMDYVRKIEEGRVDEIAPCIGCIQRCINNAGLPDGVIHSCLVNPFAGREDKWKITPAETKKKVVIIGGGPAGLEAGWVCAARGHDVVLFEKRNMPGGSFSLAAIPPYKQNIARAIIYYSNMCKKYGVKMNMDQEATVDTVLAEKPDAVIVATGSLPLVPGIPGLKKDCMTAHDVLRGAQLPGDTVLIMGGGSVGAETADYLGQYGYKVTIIDQLPQIAGDEVPAVRELLMKRLDDEHATFITGASISQVFDDGIEYVKDGVTTRLSGFDNLVLALGARPYAPLAAELEGKVPELYIVGDAKQVGNGLNAIYYATELALSI